MADTSWQRQTRDKPLFPDMLWSRPENKARAGKLLIIGGNKFSFGAVGSAYDAADRAGAGVVKVLLPDALSKTIGSLLENCEYAPTNKSGSFATSSLDSWLQWAGWSDAVLLAGDVGRNSETAIVMERFIEKYSGSLAITQDCLDQFLKDPKKLFMRQNTVIVGSFGQLQKMWPKIGAEIGALRYGASLAKNIDLLSQLTKRLPASIVTCHSDQLIVAAGGKVSTTPNNQDIWRVTTSAKAAVWYMQNPQRVFEALSTALVAD